MAVPGTALLSLLCKGIILGVFSVVVVFKGHELLKDRRSSVQIQLQPFAAVKSLSLRVSKGLNNPDIPIQQYLALCISVKDQNKDIREWIEYHEQLGVGLFYIVDNNSKTPLLPIISDFVDRGLVKYDLLQKFRHPTNRAQPYVYDRCLAEHGRKHKFIGFIDAGG